MQFFKDSHYEIINKRKIGYAISATLIVISIASLIIHGGPKYNIDFTGGTLLYLKFEKSIEIEPIRSILNDLDFKNNEIKHFGSDNDISIRLAIDQSRDTTAVRRIETSLASSFTDNQFEVMSTGSVSPKIGKELIIDAMLAVFWAMVLILFYIMWRFEFKFSIGAIVALLHDVTITMGIFSVLEIEISAPIIAAVLTIVGYSLNDTIVVFDRIRENIKSSNKNLNDISGLVNESVNETLSRTVVTSLTTLLVVVILFFFGGEVLKTFSLALIIGVVVGTYSSIFVASPIVIDWKTK